ncbi:MAG: hypothetical protein JWQ81_4371 [Amycolatopsis sp.]|nr:hypothetical protein [Amycolatopsis sp.]
MALKATGVALRDFLRAHPHQPGPSLAEFSCKVMNMLLRLGT